MTKTMALLTLGVGLLFAPPALAGGKDRHAIGERVPAFTLKTLNRDSSGVSHVTLDNHFGAGAKDPKKAVIISFFATYCKPCKKEMPFLAALYDAYGKDGLQVLLVSIDKDKPKLQEAVALADKAGVKFPVLGDRFNIVARRYYVEKLPCLYILDANGKVSFVNIGYDDNAGKVLLEQVQKALGVAPDAAVPEVVQAHLGG